MLCRLFIDPPAPGSWNMALDEALLESAADGERLSLRFYRWLEPTLSLGYFQPYEDRRRHEASRNCPAVRRASGGGAILHDREITYSFAVPPGNRLALRDVALYETVHTALIEALAGLGINASLFQGKGRGIGHIEPFLCFQRRSPGDVLLSEVKIAGSAQRRRRGAVLQHGSVLLGRSIAAPELPGLAEAAALKISFDQLIHAWMTKLTNAFSLHLEPGILSDCEKHRAEVLAGEKYGSSQWTENRGGRLRGKKGEHFTSFPPL